jgi:hypothetical protein
MTVASIPRDSTVTVPIVPIVPSLQLLQLFTLPSGAADIASSGLQLQIQRKTCQE